jgi:hypothetical protein
MTKRRPFTARDLHGAREALDHMRGQLSPEDHARMVEMVEILAELRTMVIELDGVDGDTPVGEEFLAQAIERARARRAR